MAGGDSRPGRGLPHHRRSRRHARRLRSDRGNEFLHFGTALALWGSGIADLAHDEIIANLVDAGHRTAHLRVFQANTRARRFYERHGWRPTGETSPSSFAPYPALLGYAKTLR